MIDDDLIEFMDEENVSRNIAETSLQKEHWSLLVVDDEVDVHDATKFALYGAQLLGRSVVVDSAFSAAEAKQKLAFKQYDCILLDVIMETDNAGLLLVEYIRNTLNDHLVRIILRTGQPGYAPEMEVIEKYDINDYKCKADLTAVRLHTSLVAALRAFEQIMTIDATRQGLELILEAATTLFQKKAVRQFAKGSLKQLCSLLKIKNEGILCVITSDQSIDNALILAAEGQFEKLHGIPLSKLNDPIILENIEQTLGSKVSLYKDKSSVLYINSPFGAELVVHLNTDKPLNDLDKRLLELFSIDIAVGFDTASMFEKVEALAYVDSLTRLPNKIALEHKLDLFLTRHKDLAVILLDIDNFQIINDGLGNAIGDKVLQRSAELMQQIFSHTATIGRISADIFGVILLDSTPEHIKERLQTLKQQLRDPMQIDHYQIPLSMSVGVAFFPEHDRSAKSLLQKSGIALKYAKTWSRGSSQMFDQGMEDSLVKRLNIISDLHRCIENEELRLYFQPKMDIKQGRIKGVEALIRWQKNGKLIPPDVFIAAAESSGHIIMIGDWVLREACRQQCFWRENLQLNLHMAVNVSVRQLLDPTFLQRLENTIQKSGIDPSNLELEVTESMMSNNHTIIEVLHAARNLGVNISIDDFGTGYSCLSTLQNLPVNYLKVDKSFVNKLGSEQENNTVVELIINLAHQLGLGVIAEGVETKAQEDLLLSMNCELMQGYLYAKPLLANDLLQLIEAKAWH